LKTHWLEFKVSALCAGPLDDGSVLLILKGVHSRITISTSMNTGAVRDFCLTPVTIKPAVFLFLDLQVAEISHLSPRGGGVRLHAAPSVRPPLGGGLRKSAIWTVPMYTFIISKHSHPHVYWPSEESIKTLGFVTEIIVR